MRFSLVIAALLLPSFLVVAQSLKSSLAEAHCGADADGIDDVAVITSDFNTCVDLCGDSVVAATQTALAAYNTTAGNTPTTDPTDQTFLLWAEGNAPDYNSALSDCATAVLTLRTALLNLPDSESHADEQPVEWSLGLPSTDGFPPFTVPSTTVSSATVPSATAPGATVSSATAPGATKGSGSASSNGLDNGGGLPNPTGPASRTQPGQNNGIIVTVFMIVPTIIVLPQCLLESLPSDISSNLLESTCAV
ncbi:hypothetical protein B0H19DRAFT_1275556 [Mycena capillaripes]|nr:hypothetical protein B0H19DRAFT_1275556 [Mycena capillaripes]